MWKTHGPRQRTLLVVAAVILLLVAAAVTVGRPVVRALGLDAPAAPLDVVSAHGTTAAGILTGLGAVLLLVSLWVILAALPSRPSAPTFRYRGSDGDEGMTEIDSSVIARAAQDAAEGHAVFNGARLRISGSSEAPVLYARYTLRADADAVEAMALVDERLVPDLEAGLGTAFVRRHVRFDVTEPQRHDAKHIDLTTVQKSDTVQEKRTAQEKSTVQPTGPRPMS